MITIMRDRFTRGWPRHERGDRAYVLPLSPALTRDYRTDAHFAAYVTPNGRRLTREALEVLDGVELTTLVFDVDCGEVHGSKEPAPERWRAELMDRVKALATAHPDPYVYMTRGGARIVYRLDATFVLHTVDDAREWSQRYAIAIAYLGRSFGIVADPACADWQRLYRLPHATRDRGGKPERWPTYGDPSAIGAFTFEPSVADIETAKENSKAFGERHVLDFTPCTADGLGVFFHALRARGDIIRQRGNAFVVRCPNESEHSCGRTGDGSTLLYRPALGKDLGAIHCLHGHCAGMRIRDWLCLFGDSELASARGAAGVIEANHHRGDSRTPSSLS